MVKKKRWGNKFITDEADCSSDDQDDDDDEDENEYDSKDSFVDNVEHSCNGKHFKMAKIKEINSK